MKDYIVDAGNVLFIIFSIIGLILLLYVYLKPPKTIQLHKDNGISQIIHKNPKTNLSTHEISNTFQELSRISHINPKDVQEIKTIKYGANWYEKPESVQKGFALCFSGGGAMAMTHCLGFFRGFRKSGVLKKASLISGVSGSCWAIVPSALLEFNKTIKPLSEIWGEYIPPKNYTAEQLKEFIPNSQIGHIITNQGNLARFVKKVRDNLVDNNNIPHDMAMADAFSQMILESNNMYYYNSIVQKNKNNILKLLEEYPTLKTNVEGFFYKREEFGSFSLANTGYFPTQCNIDSKSDITWDSDHIKFPIEFTEERSGFLCNDEQIKNRGESINIGGQVDNYAWNSSKTQTVYKSYFNATQNNPYNITGINQMVSLPAFAFGPLFIQNCNYSNLIPLQQATTEISNNKKIWQADGGSWDNSGITSALARKIPHLFVFLLDSALNIKQNKYPLSLSQPFGYNVSGKTKKNTQPLLPPDEFHKTAQNIELSQYSKDAPNHQENWNPAIYTKIYQCLDVPIAGIESYKVKITWIIPRRTYKYQNQLSPECYQIVENLENYPSFITSSDYTALYNLTPVQAQSVLSLDSWIASEIISPLIMS